MFKEAFEKSKYFIGGTMTGVALSTGFGLHSFLQTVLLVTILDFSIFMVALFLAKRKK